MKINVIANNLPAAVAEAQGIADREGEPVWFVWAGRILRCRPGGVTRDALHRAAVSDE